MMYAALDQAGRLVYACQVAGRHQGAAWSCPVCHQAVALRSGPRVKPHFVHVEGVCGQAKADGRQVAESPQHQEAKRLLGQTCQRQGEAVSLEYYLPASGQFADVYLPEREWVLEYQQSVIRPELLAARQADYAAQGQQVTWLMAQAALAGKLKSRWKQTCLAYHPTWGYYWLALDVPKQRLVHHYQLPLVYSRLAYRYQIRHLPLRDWGQAPWQADLLAYAQWVPQPARACQECRLRTDGYRSLPAGSQHFWRHLYRQGLQVQDLPDWCLDGAYQALLSPQPGWVWLAYQAAFLKQVAQAGVPFTVGDWQAAHRRLVAAGSLSLVATPLVVATRPDQVLADTCQAWLRLWRAQGAVAWDPAVGGYWVVAGALDAHRVGDRQ